MDEDQFRQRTLCILTATAAAAIGATFGIWAIALVPTTATVAWATIWAIEKWG